jgi:regulator of protease activity HflC (stomatin/prohibitin superfamily)
MDGKNNMKKVLNTHKIPMTTLSFDFRPVDVRSKDKVDMNINGIIFYDIIDVRKAVYYCDNLWNCMEQKIVTVLNEVTAKIDSTMLFDNIGDFSRLCSDELQKQLKEYGIRIKSINLESVDPPDDIARAIKEQYKHKILVEKERIKAEDTYKIISEKLKLRKQLDDQTLKNKDELETIKHEKRLKELKRKEELLVMKSELQIKNGLRKAENKQLLWQKEQELITLQTKTRVELLYMEKSNESKIKAEEQALILRGPDGIDQNDMIQYHMGIHLAEALSKAKTIYVPLNSKLDFRIRDDTNIQ